MGSQSISFRESTVELKSSLSVGELSGGSSSAVKTELTALSTKVIGLKSSGEALGAVCVSTSATNFLSFFSNFLFFFKIKYYILL